MPRVSTVSVALARSSALACLISDIAVLTLTRAGRSALVLHVFLPGGDHVDDAVPRSPDERHEAVDILGAGHVELVAGLRRNRRGRPRRRRIFEVRYLLLQRRIFVGKTRDLILKGLAILGHRFAGPAHSTLRAMRHLAVAVVEADEAVVDTIERVAARRGGVFVLCQHRRAG